MHDDLIERLRQRKCFWLNGAQWMMGTAPDNDCMEAAEALAQYKIDCNELIIENVSFRAIVAELEHALEAMERQTVDLVYHDKCIAAERDACAKVAEEYKPRVGQAQLSIADAIRARKP